MVMGLITLDNTLLEVINMVALNTINGYDQNMICAGEARQKLWRNGFYEEFRLQRLIEMFRSTFGNNLSSVSISPTKSTVELRFRQTYWNNNTPGFYNHNEIINTIYRWYKEYSHELIKIFNGLSGTLETDMVASMLYHLQRNGNSIIINFI